MCANATLNNAVVVCETIPDTLSVLGPLPGVWPVQPRADALREPLTLVELTFANYPNLPAGVIQPGWLAVVRCVSDAGAHPPVDWRSAPGTRSSG